MTKQTCTFTQKIVIHNRLKEELEILSEGFCYYKNSEVSDSAIAKELGVSQNVVRNIRLEIFGKLRTWSEKSKDGVDTILQNEQILTLINEISNLTNKYNDLDNRSNNMKVVINEFVVKFDKLIDTLTINRIANVHHLRLTNKENSK